MKNAISLTDLTTAGFAEKQHSNSRTYWNLSRRTDGGHCPELHPRGHYAGDFGIPGDSRFEVDHYEARIGALQWKLVTVEDFERWMSEIVPMHCVQFL